MLQKLTFKTDKKHQIIDITKILNDLLMKNSYYEGICFLFCQNSSSALTTMKLNEVMKIEDYLNAYEMPKKDIGSVNNNSQGDDIKDYLASSTLGMSLFVPVQSASMALGYDQKVVLVELAGPGDRHITVNFMKEKTNAAL